jgi:hypothetical protein
MDLLSHDATGNARVTSDFRRDVQRGRGVERVSCVLFWVHKKISSWRDPAATVTVLFKSDVQKVNHRMVDQSSEVLGREDAFGPLATAAVSQKALTV